ncbi:MAG: NAD(P)H-quinone oxidoreductase [Alphaproteobacteria bacterium]|jgi:putative PIG3 family NAD(P)H quinone oxidoreductase|nr:NAD(P)H-quinone oxidoreductase [Candidatus Jidaibacter sp.]
MKTYKAVDNRLSLETCNIPEPTDDEYLIKVKAIGLNRADLLQLKGLYNAPDGSNSLGLEVSGVVVGEGKQVAALLPSGGFSEYVCVKKALTLDIENYDLIEAASIPEAFTTCYLNLVKLGDLQNARTVLIHGGSSGIGTFAIQIAKHYGADVVTSSSKPMNIIRCKDLGASDVINYKNSFPEHYKNHFDLIMDILGASHLKQNMSALKKYGSMVTIAVMNGAVGEINMAQLLMKNLKLIGSTLRSQPDEKKYSLIRSVQKDLIPLLHNGAVKPVIDSVYTFDKMDEALEKMESGTHFGKIIVTV